MDGDVRELWIRVLRWIRRDRSERRNARDRARFWAELREGQREAEASAALRGAAPEALPCRAR